jgi:hypothetical protein
LEELPEEPPLRRTVDVRVLEEPPPLRTVGFVRLVLPPLRTVGVVRLELPPLRTVGVVRLVLPPLRTVGFVRLVLPPLLWTLDETPEVVPPPGGRTLVVGRVGAVVLGGVVVLDGGVTLVVPEPELPVTPLRSRVGLRLSEVLGTGSVILRVFAASASRPRSGGGSVRGLDVGVPLGIRVGDCNTLVGDRGVAEPERRVVVPSTPGRAWVGEVLLRLLAPGADTEGSPSRGTALRLSVPSTPGWDLGTVVLGTTWGIPGSPLARSLNPK